jgi:hypothetical protein
MWCAVLVLLPARLEWPARELRRLVDEYSRFSTANGLHRSNASGSARPNRSVWAEREWTLRTDSFRTGAQNDFVFQDDDVGTLRGVYQVLLAADRRPGGPRLLERTVEDGSFNCTVLRADDGVAISRDLLDSISELSFLARAFGEGALRRMRILDVGAGYGRLAKRFRDCFGGGSSPALYHTVDGLPQSTLLSRVYLSRYGYEDSVLELPGLAQFLAGHPVDLLVNVHSFPEMPLPDIDFWLGHAAAARVPYLFIVPNSPHSTAGRLHHNTAHSQAISHLLRRRGYELAHFENQFASLGLPVLMPGRRRRCFRLRNRTSVCYKHAVPYYLYYRTGEAQARAPPMLLHNRLDGANPNVSQRG